jgi:hypothetical protein
MPADAAYNDEFLQILHRVILEVYSPISPRGFKHLLDISKTFQDPAMHTGQDKLHTHTQKKKKAERVSGNTNKLRDMANRVKKGNIQEMERQD